MLSGPAGGNCSLELHSSLLSCTAAGTDTGTEVAGTDVATQSAGCESTTDDNVATEAGGDENAGMEAGASETVTDPV